MLYKELDGNDYRRCRDICISSDGCSRGNKVGFSHLNWEAIVGCLWCGVNLCYTVVVSVEGWDVEGFRLLATGRVVEALQIKSQGQHWK